MLVGQLQQFNTLIHFSFPILIILNTKKNNISTKIWIKYRGLVYIISFTCCKGRGEAFCLRATAAYVLQLYLYNSLLNEEALGGRFAVPPSYSFSLIPPGAVPLTTTTVLRRDESLPRCRGKREALPTRSQHQPPQQVPREAALPHGGRSFFPEARQVWWPRLPVSSSFSTPLFDLF